MPRCFGRLCWVGCLREQPTGCSVHNPARKRCAASLSAAVLPLAGIRCAKPFKHFSCLLQQRISALLQQPARLRLLSRFVSGVANDLENRKLEIYLNSSEQCPFWSRVLAKETISLTALLVCKSYDAVVIFLKNQPCRHHQRYRCSRRSASCLHSVPEPWRLPELPRSSLCRTDT